MSGQNPNLKVCLVVTSFPPASGGAETYSKNLANNLARRGHEVDVHTQATPGSQESIKTHKNVSVNRIKESRNIGIFDTLLFSTKAKREIDLTKYDIVHGELRPPSTIALSLNFRKTKVPIVVVSHGTSIDAMLHTDTQSFVDYGLKYLVQPLNFLFDTISGHLSTQVISIDEYTDKQLKENYYIPSSKISHIPNSIDTDLFSPHVDSYDGYDEKSFNILFVGRIVPIKGLDLALECISSLDRTDIELYIVGTGRSRARLETKAVTLGIEENIHFLGEIDRNKLPQYYCGADVFILPSKYEASPFVLHESMACGTPVIASNTGGIPYLINDGETGFVVERTVNEFTEKIQYLATNPQVLHDLGENSRKVSKKRTWDKNIEMIEEIYQELANPSPKNI